MTATIHLNNFDCTINKGAISLAFLSPTWTTQDLEDPLLDLRDDLAFGVKTRDKVPEISQSTEVNAKGVGVGQVRIGVPDGIQDLFSGTRPISLVRRKRELCARDV